MVFRWLAVAVVGLHLAFLAYVLTGGFLAWVWPRTFVPHLVAVTWGVVIIATKVPCPLTWLQNLLRERGGQPRLDASFIDTYVAGVFYPTEHETLARGCVALIVVVSWLGLLRAAGLVTLWSNVLR